MKYTVFVFILSMIVFASELQASEYLGSISTDPSNLGNESNIQSNSNSNKAIVPINQSVNGSVIIPSQTSLRIAAVKSKNDTADAKIPQSPSKKIINTQQILGAKIYTDGTLLRGIDKKIYIIQAQSKKHIVNQQALRKYRGQKIMNVSAKILEKFHTKQYLNGELIRQKGTVKIFAIQKGVKQHVVSLQELLSRYAGLEILNLNRLEMN
jgi:hypothetical protein